MTLSVVIPARNAADTLARSLDCLLAQTRGDWEAIVVDDGSTDDTVSLVQAYAGRDARIRLLADGRASEGVSAARNRGIAAARGEWLLFLDADDTVLPAFAETMLGRLQANPGSRIAYCACRRLTPDGKPGPSWLSSEVARAPFELFARQCPVAVHAFVIDRALVVELGGFEVTLRTSEDWDFWLRVARTGTRFLLVPDTLALYRMRRGSLSSDVRAMIPDARRVIASAFAADPRVSRPAPLHAAGADPSAAESPEMALGYFALSCAAVDVGQGGDGLDIVLPLPDRSGNVAERCRSIILDGLSVGTCRLPAELPGDDAGFVARVRRLLERVEDAAARPGLARLLEFALEPEVFAPARPGARLVAGTVLHVRLQVARPRAIAVPEGVDTVHLEFRDGGALLARTEAAAFGDLSAREVAVLALQSISLSVLLRRGRFLAHPMFPVHVAREAVRAAARIVTGRLRRTGPGRPTLRVFLKSVLSKAILAQAGKRGGGSEPRLAALVAEARNRAAALEMPAAGPPVALPPPSGSGGDAPPADRRQAYWERVYATPDPWDYGSPYEQTKYRRTLALLPPGPVGHAVELACSEGRFTEMLAPHVGRLTASDISQTALDRARARCRAHDNIDYRRLDLFDDALPADLDLVVCSEVLYDLADRTELARVCHRLTSMLAPGGHLLAAHAHVLKDDPTRTGFDWDSPFGATVIADTLAATPGLALERSMQSDLYRIDLFRRLSDGELPPVSAIERVDTGPAPTPEHAYAIVWGGAVMRRAEARERETTDRVPILNYHRIASEGPASLARYRTTPEAFADQMRWLRRYGYHAIAPADLARQMASGRPMAGRPVMLTFDDGYRDFHDAAWPILQAHDFTADVMLVTGRIGGTADWDAAHGPPAPLMGWSEIQRLAASGVRFGSHLATHRRVSEMTGAELVREAAESQALIERAIAAPCIALAAPFGDSDARLLAIARACGYRIGLGTDPGHARLGHDPLRLPRIEVQGGWSIETFKDALRPPG